MKIAVCLSGETRNYNQDLADPHARGPMDFVHELQKHFDTVDVFGHTWQHCEIPSNHTDFKKFKQQDQQVIADWVTQDFVNRVYTDGGEGNFNSYNKLNDLGPDKFIESYLEKSKAIYGQTWSASECFDLVPLNEYDIVVRYRWDLRHEGDSKFFKDTVVNRILWICGKFFDHNNDTPLMVSTCNGHVSTGWPQPEAHIEDTFFILSGQAHCVVCQVAIADKLDQIIEKNMGRMHMPAHHSLWRSVLFTQFDSDYRRYPVDNDVLQMHLTLPNMFNISSDSSWVSPGSGRDTGPSLRENRFQDNEDIMPESNLDN